MNKYYYYQSYLRYELFMLREKIDIEDINYGNSDSVNVNAQNHPNVLWKINGVTTLVISQV